MLQFFSSRAILADKYSQWLVLVKILSQGSTKHMLKTKKITREAGLQNFLLLTRGGLSAKSLLGNLIMQFRLHNLSITLFLNHSILKLLEILWKSWFQSSYQGQETSSYSSTVRDCLHSTGVATLLLNNYLSSSGVATLLGTVLRFRDSNPTWITFWVYH